MTIICNRNQAPRKVVGSQMRWTTYVHMPQYTSFPQCTAIQYIDWWVMNVVCHHLAHLQFFEISVAPSLLIPTQVCRDLWYSNNTWLYWQQGGPFSHDDKLAIIQQLERRGRECEIFRTRAVGGLPFGGKGRCDPLKTSCGPGVLSCWIWWLCWNVTFDRIVDRKFCLLGDPFPRVENPKLNNF